MVTDAMPRPARPWFRVYAELLDNPKIQRLKPTLRCHWLNLACLACSGSPRGTLPPVDDCAFRLRLSVTVMSGILEELTALRLVDANGDRFVMHDWDEWQYESDANLTPGRATKTETGRKDGGSAALSPRNERAKPAVARRRAEADTEQIQKQSRAEPEQSDPVSAVCAKFAHYGSVTASTVRAIEDDVEDFGIEWVTKAERKASAASFTERPGWSYVRSILERWQKQGKPDDEMEQANGKSYTTQRVPAGSRGRSDSPEGLIAELEAWQRGEG